MTLKCLAVAAAMLPFSITPALALPVNRCVSHFASPVCLVLSSVETAADHAQGMVRPISQDTAAGLIR